MFLFRFSENQLEETIGQFVSGDFIEEDFNKETNNELLMADTDHGDSVEGFVLSLLAEIGPEMVEMTISLFAEDATRHISEIATALHAKDGETLSDLAASFALACDDINATDFRSLCLLLEAKARNENIEGAEILFKEIKSAYNSILERLEQIQCERV